MLYSMAAIRECQHILPGLCLIIDDKNIVLHFNLVTFILYGGCKSGQDCGGDKPSGAYLWAKEGDGY